jgi:hypothetical protein
MMVRGSDPSAPQNREDNPRAIGLSFLLLADHLRPKRDQDYLSTNTDSVMMDALLLRPQDSLR